MIYTNKLQSFALHARNICNKLNSKHGTLLGVLFLLGLGAAGLLPSLTGSAQAAGPALTSGVSLTPLQLVTLKSTATSSALAAPAQTKTATTDPSGMGPLTISPQNGRYFQRPDGKAVLLSGSHTWADFQDSGWGSPTIHPPAFDYAAYLDFLQQNNHNFTRLWTWEQTRWTNEASQDDYWFYPQSPYVRTQSGPALDGGGKFDLNQFDQGYFDRLRQRVVDAGNHGIYISVMLFNGWSIQDCKGGNCQNNPWKGHPYNAANNVSAVNGDLNANNSGEETQTLASPQITALQEAYIRKVVDTVGDLNNVLYEISNEGPSNSQDWQYHMINYIKTYEAGRPKKLILSLP